MSGWKTWAGGLLGILTGVVTIVKTVADGHFSLVEVQTGLAMVAGGLSVLGIGHKLERGIDAVKENTETTK